MLNIGRYIAIRIKPMVTPIKIIMIGSSRSVNSLTLSSKFSEKYCEIDENISPKLPDFSPTSTSAVKVGGIFQESF